MPLRLTTAKNRLSTGRENVSVLVVAVDSATISAAGGRLSTRLLV